MAEKREVEEETSAAGPLLDVTTGPGGDLIEHEEDGDSLVIDEEETNSQLHRNAIKPENYPCQNDLDDLDALDAVEDFLDDEDLQGEPPDYSQPLPPPRHLPSVLPSDIQTAAPLLDLPADQTATSNQSGSSSVHSTTSTNQRTTPSNSSLLTATSNSKNSLDGDPNVHMVQCAICSKPFKNFPALNGHMRLHLNTTSNQFGTSSSTTSTSQSTTRTNPILTATSRTLSADLIQSLLFAAGRAGPSQADLLPVLVQVSSDEEEDALLEEEEEEGGGGNNAERCREYRKKRKRVLSECERELHVVTRRNEEIRARYDRMAYRVGTLKAYYIHKIHNDSYKCLKRKHAEMTPKQTSSENIEVIKVDSENMSEPCLD